MKAYQKVKIYKESLDLAIDLYLLTIDHDLYSEGRKVRGLAEELKATIVNAFQKNRNASDYQVFLTTALQLAFDVRESLDVLCETEHLERETEFLLLSEKYGELAKDIYKFRENIRKGSFPINLIHAS